MKVLFVYANLEMSSMVPLGLASMSARIKQAGHDSAVFDTTFFKTGKNENLKRSEIGQVLGANYDDMGIVLEDKSVFDSFRETVLYQKPDLIALGIVEDTFNLGINLLLSISDLNVKNIVGGVFATFSPETVINEECVDIVCVGEGEDTLLNVCNALEATEADALQEVRGIWIKTECGIKKTPPAELVDLDTLPIPDYDIWEKKMLYRPMQGELRLTVAIETQRGCPFTCAFCNSPSQNDLSRENTGRAYHRRKSVRKIQEELAYLVERFNPDLIYWVADTFLAMPEKEWDEFREMYSDYRLPFWMNTRIETITSKRLIDLEHLNALRFNVGVEHGNFEFRKNVIKRRTTNQQIKDKFKLFRGCPIPVIANIIIGYPGETEELIQDSLRLIREIADYFDAIQVFIFAPYHGTPLRQVAIEKGYINGSEIVNAGLISGSILKSPHWTNEQLKSIQRTFPLYAKMPERYFPDIKRAEKFDDEGRAIFDDLVKIYQEEYMKKAGSSQAKLEQIKEDLVV
jgi:anaerobic magnesium-protoporphyrin IX monomethyl ester cyclase